MLRFAYNIALIVENEKDLTNMLKKRTPHKNKSTEKYSTV